MSTVMLQRSIPVCWDAREVGEEFASAPMDVQIEFFLGFLDNIDKWGETASWPMQCRFIVDDMTPADKARLAGRLDTLLEHLKEPVT